VGHRIIEKEKNKACGSTNLKLAAEKSVSLGKEKKLQ
jgi:hypothetical protein